MSTKTGRTRDATIDVKVLAVASHHLALHGYEALSLTAVAEEAGTTRQALHRRWPSKADLASAVVTAIPGGAATTVIEDPFGNLVAELAHFQHGVSRPGRLSLVGTMLQEITDPEVVAQYRARIIAPRRARLRAIFEQAQRLGLIDLDADLEVAVTMCTGSWYGRALAGLPAPPDWPRRAAALVWRAVGGQVPLATDEPYE